MILKVLLIVGIVITAIYMLMLVTNTDREFMLSFKSTQGLIDRYSKMTNPQRRIVVILECENGLCEDTLKSILDQSVKVSEIAVETNFPERFQGLSKVVSFHKPGTIAFRENEADSIIMVLKNGKIFDYDFIENSLKNLA